MGRNLLIETTKQPRPAVCHNGVRRAVGEKCELLGKVEWLPPLDKPDLDTMPSCIYLYPKWMNEVDPPVESEVRIVNEPFDMSKVICST